MFNARGRFFSDAGSRTKQKYHAAYDSAGRVVLKPDGEEDIYSQIQSHAASVDIHVLLKRFASGDVSVLSQRQGIYADITEMPRTYADLLNTVNDLERRFLSLPPDIRERFGNSFSRYAASIGTPAYVEALGLKPETGAAAEQQSIDINAEVKTGE